MSAAQSGIPARTNLKVAVARVLRERIFSGELRPGSRIEQDGLAEELGVSKLPVREALIGLESEGLVTTAPRRGAFVAALTESDIRDHFRIFGVVSALAAETAATSLSPEQLGSLTTMVARMREEGDFDRLQGLSHAFHREINKTASRRIQSVIGLLAGSMPARFNEFATGWEATSHAEHEEIAAALLARDPERAAAATEAHFRRNGELATTLLRSSGFWSGESETAVREEAG